MYTILVVDDEQKLRETLYDYLTFKMVDVFLARNGEEAVELCYDQEFDLILMDVMMPQMNGIEACQEIRKTSNVPILFLTALGEEADMLKGYAVGADDYIVKPFPLAVLYEKCVSIISRYRGISDGKRITAGALTIDVKGMKVYLDGNPLAISGKDYELLVLLVQNKGQIVSRESILNKLWGYEFEGSTRVVDTHIKRLRKQLGKYGSCIKTKINVGYSFVEGIA